MYRRHARGVKAGRPCPARRAGVTLPLRSLTEVRPQVVSVYALDGDNSKLLALAGAVEARSDHPLARAVLHEARRPGIVGDGDDT